MTFGPPETLNYVFYFDRSELEFENDPPEIISKKTELWRNFVLENFIVMEEGFILAQYYEIDFNRMKFSITARVRPKEKS